VLDGLCHTVYLSDATNEQLQVMIVASVFRTLVELSGHPFPSILILGLWTKGNILMGDGVFTRLMINNVATMIKKSKWKEACGTVSNLSAIKRDKIHAIQSFPCGEVEISMNKRSKL
jgi:hypothetical protein